MERFIRALYSLLFYLLLPGILLRMLWRSRRAPDYRKRLGERFGLWDSAGLDSTRPVIWIHAVSVGETLAAVPLVEALLDAYPGYQLALTTTTPTGSERVRALFGNRVFHVYAPWDLPGATDRFLRRLQPRLLVLIETELWPNLLHYCGVHGCQVMLANARLSERSAAGYARIPALVRPMLEQLSAVACQAEADGERLVALGLPPERLHVTGSIKFDLALDPDVRERAQLLEQSWQGDKRTIIVGASTHAGEDEQLLAVFARLRETVSGALLVLVPRHPERFADVFALCERSGWQVQRRSAGLTPGPDIDVVVGDTMGELVLLLGAADIAIIGGSLVEHGGHNALEAAAWGVPVIAGPYMFNFLEISRLLVKAGAMIQLEQAGELEEVLIELALDPQRRKAMGVAGERVVRENRGAREQLMQLIAGLVPS